MLSQRWMWVVLWAGLAIAGALGMGSHRLGTVIDPDGHRGGTTVDPDGRKDGGGVVPNVSCGIDPDGQPLCPRPGTGN